MGKHTPEITAPKPMRRDVLQRMVAEWIAAGCTVEIEPDGKIRVTPPAVIARGPDPDLIDWARK